MNNSEVGKLFWVSGKNEINIIVSWKVGPLLLIRIDAWTKRKKEVAIKTNHHCAADAQFVRKKKRRMGGNQQENTYIIFGGKRWILEFKK